MPTLQPKSAQFWSTQASWLSAHTAAQAGSGIARSRTLSAKEARWRTNGARFLRKTKLSPGVVRPDPAMQQAILELIEAVAPALAKAFDDHFAPLAMNAFDRWPVDTGLSKSLLSLEYTTELGGTNFVGTVRSGAPYSVFIRSGLLTSKQRDRASSLEDEKRSARGRAIREAAKKAGKEHLLFQGRTSTDEGRRGGNRGSGPQVVQALLIAPAPGVVIAIGNAAIANLADA